MDNNTATNKTTAGILVDYDYYRANPRVRAFIDHRQDRASLIVLVSTPDTTDPDFFTLTDPAWDVIIRNSKNHPDKAFKISALSALQAHSNVYPAVSIDWFNEDVFDEAGSLIHLGGETFG